MGILSRFFNKKNKFVHPPPSVMENPDNSDDKGVFGKAVIEKMADRSYHSTWFADPKSSTGRRYSVQVFGEMGKVEAGGETLGVAIQKANKEYDKKIK